LQASETIRITKTATRQSRIRVRFIITSPKISTLNGLFDFEFQ
jgi:hypothetical protein